MSTLASEGTALWERGGPQDPQTPGERNGARRPPERLAAVLLNLPLRSDDMLTPEDDGNPVLSEVQLCTVCGNEMPRAGPGCRHAGELYQHPAELRRVGQTAGGHLQHLSHAGTFQGNGKGHLLHPMAPNPVFQVLAANQIFEVIPLLQFPPNPTKTRAAPSLPHSRLPWKGVDIWKSGHHRCGGMRAEHAGKARAS